MKNKKEIREKFNELRDSFFKSKIKEIRKIFIEEKTKKKFPHLK